jgi:ATP-dependent RNA helicase RhlE
MSFEHLNIHPRLVEQLANQRITEPTPIQAQAIPPALEGRDLVAIAQTGTGKTLAFGLPALTRLAKNKHNGTRMLVLTPTRELAIQVASVLGPLGEPHGLNVTCIYGGVGYEPQTKALRRGAPIVIATPGRLIDHINQKNVRFESLSVLVLDEADRMLDMGFIPDIKRILNALPADRQTMMFSATFPKEIARLAGDFQRDPVRIEVGAISRPADDVTQRVYAVEQDRKVDLLCDLLGHVGVESTLVFIRTKHRTDRVAKKLKQQGLKAMPIHGGRSQSQRNQALSAFREGKCNVLVATDVAARGIDVQGITHVINFDIPKTTEDYVHRIGRTARAKAKGDAITFVAPEDVKALRDIERELGIAIERAEWDGAFTLPATQPVTAHREGQRNGNGRVQSPRQQAGKPRSRRGRGPANAARGHARNESQRDRHPRGDRREGERRESLKHENRRERTPATASNAGAPSRDDKLRAPSVLGNRTVRREPRKLGQFSRPKMKRPA